MLSMFPRLQTEVSKKSNYNVYVLSEFPRLQTEVTKETKWNETFDITDQLYYVLVI